MDGKLVLFIFFIFLFSCGCNKNKLNLSCIDLDNMRDISINDIFSKIEVIPLETSKSCLLNNVDKVEFKNNSYYVLDKKQKAVFIFSETGKFIDKIKKIGRGPDEYTEIADYDINPLNMNIEILTPRGEILEYDPQLNFIKSIKLNGIRAVHYFKNLNRDTILLYQEFEYERIAFYSRNQNMIIKKMWEVPLNIVRKTYLNSIITPFYTFRDSVFFYEPFSNSIHWVNGTNIKKRISWIFNKNNFDLTMLPPEGESSDYYNNYLKNSDFAHCFIYNMETENYFFSIFMYKKNWVNMIFDKSKNDYFVFRKFKEGLMMPMYFPFSKGVYAIINPENYQLFIKNELLDKSFQATLGKIKFEDNPFVIKFYYK